MNKKIVGILVCTLLITSVALPVAGTTFKEKIRQSSLEEPLTVILQSGEYYINSAENGYTEILIEDFGSLITPREPTIPSKIFYIVLPPGGEVISIETVNIKSEEIPGFYKIKPGLPLLGDETTEVNQEIYESNNPYPSNIYEYLGMSQMRKYSLAMIRFFPITYYPVDGKLIKHNSIKLKIIYKVTKELSEELLADKALDDLASALITNYESIKECYKTSYKPIRQPYDFVIITTASLVSSVVGFQTYKQALGYNVNIVTISWITTNYPASDTQASIRSFLVSNYASWGIKYVLIVGSHNTIPMRTCYPDPTNHANDGIHDIPTDYYYADLTGNWDSDGDGFYGERGQDSVDFTPEVWVGRIPVDVGSTVTSILSKIQNFEGTSYTGWKKNAMLLGAVYFYANEDYGGNARWDGAEVMEQCKNNLLSGFSITTMYEKSGLGPSSYSCNYSLTNANFVSQWSGSSGWGIVNWAAHGAPTFASRKVWSSDDGDNVPESFEMTWPVMIQNSDASGFNNNKPPIVFAASCYVSHSETTNNVGTSLLVNGATAFVGATRVSYGSMGWTQPSHGGHGTYCYDFTDRIANNVQFCGPALYDAKQYTYNNYPWNSWHDNANMYNFNLYGDPTMGMSAPPQKPIPPSGPTSGYTGIQYYYSTQTWDPTGDNVKYGWDWNGDGTVDEWDDNNGNYYPSGQLISTPHIFSSPGTYNIQVKAEDQYGVQSSFSSILTVVILQNQGPTKPTKPSGPTKGKPGQTYTYTTSATDPEGYNLEYGWDWNGDGTVDEWDNNNGNYYPSGQQIGTSHSWSSQGRYKILVKGRDIHGYEGSWSDPLEVNIPRSKASIQLLIFRLLERFPTVFTIFKYILGLQ